MKKRLLLTLAVWFGFSLLPSHANARITSITVNESRAYERQTGYTYAQITMAGTVSRADGSTGHYSVPAVVIYPTSGNGVGVVDWLNSAFYHFFPPETEFGVFQFTLLTTDNYLFENGFTYVSVQWNKLVTETFGPTVPAGGVHNPLVFGTIEQGADAWEILLDAARLLKDPRTFPGGGLHAVRWVIGSGYSQGAALQQEMLVEGFDPTNVYDGHLIAIQGYSCWRRDNTPPHYGFLGNCNSSIPAHSQKVIYLASESDMVAFHPSKLGVGQSAFFARNPDDPNWRQYEISGTSHIPKTVVDLGVPNQNSGDSKPVHRAAWRNLVDWLRGIEPPASRYFEGGIGGDGNFMPVTDADGNWRGGLRLPHVNSVINGRQAGAATGVYSGLNPAGLNPFNVFVFLGGTYTPFADADLAARYPNHGAYVRRVARAADHLKANRYILTADADAIVRAAANK